MNVLPAHVLDVSRTLNEPRRWWIQVSLAVQAAVTIALFLGLAVLLVTTPTALLIAVLVELIDWLTRAVK